ncbi:MAG: ABC transporter ATP-binding protein [Faecousia sp.]
MLKLTNITKTFAPGTVNQKTALCGIDLHLAPGDFVTVLGSNGAGKSTLFSAIAGSIRPDTGSVVLDGQDVTALPDYKRSKYIGRLFQDPLKGTAPNMTIAENLALAYLRSSGRHSPFSMVSAAERREFRDRLSQLGLGLEDRMDSPVGLLSGGQRQALTLLMATLVTPKLLLLDEHTAALDPATAEKVLELTKSIVAQNRITCLMITHDISSALQLGNRTIIMNAGKIVGELDGPERANMDEGQLLEVFRRFRLNDDRLLFRETP